ncbi:MAG: hypothetical protein CMB48_03460 [Euryarchaeota archaeon]|nr:hypothetical protein [Euryarchaeota archaeon]
MEKYEQKLFQATQECYDIATRERKKGLDFSSEIEIPRAEDLAGRTEKLLVDYLDGLEIAEKIRKTLEETNKDRETTAIKMSIYVAQTLLKLEKDRETCADVALRVGLAILTEAVLVAPLEGIARSRILNNIDGSEFLSIYFTGPIRAAGGTGQALAVLIADMIRRELGIGRYVPTTPEVERVKEEFGLYRIGLQYKPTPDEIDRIVRACPVMINGESTERVECAGYARVRNIDDSRVRGGVLLVIGEGLCLKAPKLRKHTERLGVTGWDFITEFANRSSGSGEVSYWIDDGQIWLSSNINETFIQEAKKIEGVWNSNKNAWGFSLDKEKDILAIAEKIYEVKPKLKSKKIEKIWKYMKDIIAGRPVLGDPSAPGGFRLRYGRSRNSGLAAGAINPVSMYALDDFLTIGTQMKIERPGKATAITPCDEIEGPWLLLNDGRFSRIDKESKWQEVKNDVLSIWDAGEILLGYGEFLENNKSLVPAGYGMDRWASELIKNLNTETKLSLFSNIMGISRTELPDGLPTLFSAAGHIWAHKLRSMKLDWNQTVKISKQFKTSLCPPFNLWWKDLPLEWISSLDNLMKDAIIEKNNFGGNFLRFKGASKNWNKDNIPKAGCDISVNIVPGHLHNISECIDGKEVLEDNHRIIHGIIKSSLMVLGIEHLHEDEDILAISGWEALLDGLGYSTENLQESIKPRKILDINEHCIERIRRLKIAYEFVSKEELRLSELNERKRVVKIKAETEARQQGMGISETVEIGKKAMFEIKDTGPEDFDKLSKAEALIEEHERLNSLWLVKKCSQLRIEDGAGTRIGCRMGRPEKAAPREMKPAAHAIFPLGNNGGPQKLMGVAASQENLRINLGSRKCNICGELSPSIKCTNIDSSGNICRGYTIQIESEKMTNKFANKRNISVKTVYLKRDLENARMNLGLERLPPKIKGMKELSTKSKIPEPLEKGILRAKYSLPVFRDGTIRYDMSDVPLTHFTPLEVNTSYEKLVKLGYTHDIHGMPLSSNNQLIELFPQDFVVSKNCIEFLNRVANFIDDLLERYYGTEKFYCINDLEDLVGQLIIGLAPHTSGGVLGRIIGWSDTSGGYAHPLFHAAKRRNCDGDEDCIMLLMDGLLNFSRQLLPNRRGGLMDAPLVLTTRLNPFEIDKEALNVDAAWNYSSEFYEAADKMYHPKELEETMGTITSRLKEGQFVALRGLGFTHGTENISNGPELSSYKTLETMKDKMNGQLALGHRLRSVDVSRVASTVVRSHFLPDLRGNLLAFTRQKVRCTKCGHSYRRMPLAGKCISKVRFEGQGLGKHSLGNMAKQQFCGGSLALTVSQGAVRKYIEITKHVIETYGVDHYTKQNVEWLVSSTDSLFNNDKSKQLSLSDFF